MSRENTLTRESVDDAAEKIAHFLGKNRVNRKDILRIRIAAEEVLLTYLERLGESAPLQVLCHRRFGRIEVGLKVFGECVRLTSEFEESGEWVQAMMENLAATPRWQYRNGWNIVTFSVEIPRKLPDYAWILLAMVLGGGLGFAAKALPNGLGQTISTTYLMPVSDAIMGFLSAFSIIMIFVSVISGICGMDDLGTFRKIGRRMILRFVLILAVCMALGLAVTLLFVPLQRGEGGGLNGAALWQMLLDMIPTNIPQAFLSGNAVQIIVLAICSGAALLALSTKVQGLTDLINQVNDFTLTIIRFVIRFMPVVVFISLFKLVVEGELRKFAVLYKYPLLMLLCSAVVLLFFLLRTAIIHKVSVVVLLRKLLPTGLIAAATASSAAAFSENLSTCKNRLGISEKIAAMGVPLGQVLFRPCMILQPLCGCLCFAELYHVAITPQQLIPLLLSIFVLAIAEPPIPGILAVVLTLLFSQVGIPLEAISLVIAFEVLLDRLGTCTNLSALQLELVQLSGTLHQLDQERLRNDKA